MERVRYYTDEHVGAAIVLGLRRRGVDVLTVVEAGLRGATDEAHLTRALSEGRAIFTQDADFLRLHAEGVEHAGIVFAVQGTAIGTIIQGLMLVYDVLSDEDMRGHVEFL